MADKKQVGCNRVPGHQEAELHFCSIGNGWDGWVLAPYSRGHGVTLDILLIQGETYCDRYGAFKEWGLKRIEAVFSIWGVIEKGCDHDVINVDRREEQC